MPNNSHLLVTADIKKQFALVIIEGFPMIAAAIIKNLKSSAVTVHITSSNKKMLYDYIILAGEVKKPDRYIRNLKNGGKILWIRKSVFEEVKEVKNDKNHIPTFIIHAGKRYRSDHLVRQILQSLFTSHPYSNQKQIKKLSNSIKKKNHTSNKTKLTLLIFTILFLLLLPYILVFSTTLFSALQIKHSVSNIDTIRTQNIKLNHIATIMKFNQSTWTILKTPIHLVSPEISQEITDGINIISNSAQASNEAILLLNTLHLAPKTPIQQIITTVSENKDSVHSKLSTISNHLSNAYVSSSRLNQKNNSLLYPQYSKIYTLLLSAHEGINQLNELIDTIPSITGFDGEKKYLILLQNNFELRPTGGFLGSYALISVQDANVKNLEFFDIYQADGQLKGNVEPPSELARYLNQPNWFFRDSNWDPNFETSALQAEWFLEKETGQKVDGTIALDLEFIKQLLQATGPIYVPDYDTTVSANDFFYKLQVENEENVFAGSAKKKNLIQSLATGLAIVIKDQDNLNIASLIQTVQTSLKEKHIQIFLHSQKNQDSIERLGWSGALYQIPTSKNQEEINDYNMWVEANVGVNKVNKNIYREFVSTIEIVNHNIQRLSTIHLKNESSGTAVPYTGMYKTYERLYIPNNGKLESVTVNGRKISDKLYTSSLSNDKQIIGLYIEVPQNESRSITITYTLALPQTNTIKYRLLVQKQAGTNSDPFVLSVKTNPPWKIIYSNIDSFPYATNLLTDKFFSIDFTKR